VPWLLRRPNHLLHDALIPTWGNGAHGFDNLIAPSLNPIDSPGYRRCDSRTEEACLMASPVLYGGAAGISLALAIMPAMACPRQVGASVIQTAPRVRVIATGDGFAIAPKISEPVAAAVPRTVPVGAQMQIDRDAFECSARRFASAGK
jgi:hypothetical protein